jgi:uncharacterized protein (DUF1330 family)
VKGTDAHSPEDRKMAYYAIFDVEIHDPSKYREYMTQIKPALEAVGGRYLVRGGAHKVLEGDWHPKRLVIVEFPDPAAMQAFYESATYQGLKALREAASTACLVSVEGANESR